MSLATSTSDNAVIAQAEAATETLKQARTALSDVIFGQEIILDHTLTTILAGGHALIVGVPGLAKTKLVETMGTVLGLAE